MVVVAAVGRREGRIGFCFEREVWDVDDEIEVEVDKVVDKTAYTDAAACSLVS